MRKKLLGAIILSIGLWGCFFGNKQEPEEPAPSYPGRIYITLFDSTSNFLIYDKDALSQLASHHLNFSYAPDMFVDGEAGYIASDSGLIIVDLARDDSISVAGFYPSSPSSVTESNGTAYVVSNDSILVLNVENPSSITLLGTFYDANYYHLEKLYLNKSTLFVGSLFDGLIALDVSSTSSPTFLYRYSIDGAFLQDFDIENDYAVMAYGDSGLVIVDVSGSSPQKIGAFNPGYFARTVEASNGYAYVVFNLDSGDSLLILDITTPSSIKRVASLYLGNDIDRDFLADGRYYTLTNDWTTYTGRIIAVNVSDPSNASIDGDISTNAPVSSFFVR